MAQNASSPLPAAPRTQRAIPSSSTAAERRRFQPALGRPLRASAARAATEAATSTMAAGVSGWLNAPANRRQPTSTAAKGRIKDKG